MSTKGQVFIKDINVYLYQFADAMNLFDIVKNAITSYAGRRRRDDPPYLARIIFEEMISDSFNKEIGYGIDSFQYADIDYLVTVDCNNHTITNEQVGFDEKEIFNF